MEDSLKGFLVTVTIIGLFITAVINFIVLFPQEQGVTFDDAQDQDAYLTIAEINDTGLVSNLETVNNQTENAFDQWDVTTGFMGTNQLKQGQGGIRTSTSNIFSNVRIIAVQLFTANSPIIYAILVISTLSISYLIYVIVKYVRTGN